MSKARKKSLEKPLAAAPRAVSVRPSLGAAARMVVILQLTFLAFQFNPDLSTNGDDATYYVLGTALAQAKGYRDIHIVGTPPDVAYPVVFPLFVGVNYFFARSPLLPKIAVGIVTALVSVCSFFLFRRFLPQTLLLPLLILVAGSALQAEYGYALLSEIPYLLLTVIGFIMYDRSKAAPSNRALFWAAGLVSILPIHCRSVGLAFSAAWLSMCFLDKKYRAAALHVALLAVTLFLHRALTSWNNPYLLQLFQMNSYDPEMGMVSAEGMLARIGDNVRTYAGALLGRSALALPTTAPARLVTVVSLTILCLTATGWLRNLLGGMKGLSLYAVFYVAILCMWQAQWSSERFLVPLLPYVYCFATVGLCTLCASMPVLAATSRRAAGMFWGSLRSPPVGPAGWKQAAVLWVFVALVAGVNVYGQIQASKHPIVPGPDWKNYYSCGDWLRVNTPGSAVVMSRKQELLYLRSQRRGCCYPFSHDPEKVIQTMRDKGITHVVFDNFQWTRTTAAYLYPAITSHPELFRVVYALKNPDTFVFEFRRQ